MVGWSHVIIEVYCTRTWSTKKSKYLFEAIDLRKGKFKKINNSSFDPNYRIPKKPSYCPSGPSYVCLERNCPYLDYTNALKEDYEILFKKYKKPKKKKT